MRRTALWSAAVTLIGSAALSWTPTTAQATPTSPVAGNPAAVHTTRACPAPRRPGEMACLALVRTDTGSTIGIEAPAGLGPADLQSAYKLPSATAGSGQTVAIVDAMDDPNAEADLATYRSTFGLPPCTTANGCFRKVNENGAASPLPASDVGWGEEISLDLDMVSAVCPNCHILLVEANQPTINDLGTAVNTAVNLGAKYVSNSYGGGEFSGEATVDSQFYNHPGVAVTVSSGDSGFGVEFPASASHVVAVGGTSLSRSTNTRGWSESAWNGAGSGCSAFIAKPTWQHDTGCSRRTVADVSAVADPATGVAVYDTFGTSGFLVFGGTSASAPIVAGVYALAGPPPVGSNPASFPYTNPGALFDVVGGSNGTCSPSYLCTAVTGYDGPTGLGTPNGTAAFTGGGGGGGGGGCTAAQLLGNPGFETGSAAPWSATAGVIQNSAAGEPAHSGSWLAWLDGYGTTHTDTLSQTVTIPASCTSASLSFFLHIDTNEGTTTTAFDRFTVQVNTTTVATFSNLNHATGYAPHSFSLNSFIGQTVTLKFTGTEDSSLQTSFVVDDTAINVS